MCPISAEQKKMCQRDRFTWLKSDIEYETGQVKFWKAQVKKYEDKGYDDKTISMAKQLLSDSQKKLQSLKEEMRDKYGY